MTVAPEGSFSLLQWSLMRDNLLQWHQISVSQLLYAFALEASFSMTVSLRVAFFMTLRAVSL